MVRGPDQVADRSGGPQHDDPGCRPPDSLRSQSACFLQPRRLRVVILPFEFLLNLRICELTQLTRMNRVTRLNNWLRLVCLAMFFGPSHVRCQPQSELSGLYDQARALEKQSDYAAAERVYRKALELVPGNPETLK